MCKFAKAASSCSFLHSCTCSVAPLSSPVLPLGADTEDRRPIQSIYCVKVQSGMLFSPKSSQSSLLFPRPGLRRGRPVPTGANWRRWQPLFSRAYLLLWGFAALRSGFPGGRGCSYTLNNTGTVVLSATPFRSAKMNTKSGTYCNLCSRYNRYVCFF